jgi:hypothetical protein
MKVNMGTADRAIRIVAAVVIIVLYARNVVSGTLGIVLLAVAALFLGTGLTGFCPGYLPFGLSTKPKTGA